MYVKAEKLQDIQRDILKKMEKKLESIKRNFKGDKKLIGEIVNLKITDSHLYYLTGELVDE